MLIKYLEHKDQEKKAKQQKDQEMRRERLNEQTRIIQSERARKEERPEEVFQRSGKK